MPTNRSRIAYTLRSLASTLLEEAVLAFIALWVLPRFEIHVPLWLVISGMVAWGAWSGFTFRQGLAVIGKTPAVGAEALIGVRGITTTPLTPNGYVRVGSELWLAHSIAGNVGEGSEVTIVDVKGLTLLVTPLLTAASEHSTTHR